MLALLATRRAVPLFLPSVRYKHTLYLLPKRSRRGWAIKWAKMTVKLTKEEEQLCTLLNECTTHIKETKGLETECRIAGGWVRDKVHTTTPFRARFALTPDAQYSCWVWTAMT